MSPKLLAAIAIPAALLLPATVAAPAEAAGTVTATPTATAPAVHVSRHERHLRVLARKRHLAHLAYLARLAAAKTACVRVVAEAKKWIGTPYRYGGTTRKGVDCAGFTQAVMRAVGKKIPRTAAAQLAAGRSVRTPRPGDLYFYNAGHVVLIVKVSRGRVVLTEAARHSGTVVGFQVPYAAGLVRAFLA